MDPTLPVRSLSIAEQQMVEIAKVISRGGKVIVFDEPTTSLTKEETNHLYKIIEKLKNREWVLFTLRTDLKNWKSLPTE